MAWMNRRQALAGTAVCLCAPFVGRAEPAGPWPTVQKLLDGYVADKRYAGVAAALSYGDAPIAYLSAGTLAYDTQVRVTADSIFRIYSVTKPVTGIAAMLLVEDGLLALDQPVADILPEFRQMRVAVDPAKSLESRPATQIMTMRHLLTHTSGLSNWQPFLGKHPVAVALRKKGLTPGSFGNRVVRPGHGPQVRNLDAMITGLATIPLLAEPGTAWNYSIGLDVMGAVIERVTGNDLDSFMKKRIFAPLGMASTGFQLPPSAAPRLTTLYEAGQGGSAVVDEARDSVWLKPPTLTAGGGGLASTAHDLSRFAAMLRGKGELDGVRVMKAERVALAMSNILPPTAPYPPTGGFGAGASVVMPGIKSENGPPGTFSALGASSTMLTIDPARRGISLFLAQYMPNSGPSAATYRGEFNRAADTDLQNL